MFIDFEGIDGSGKTTLSNRLAKRLAKLGYRVVHAREGGELVSPTARRIRELTRDSRLMEMSPTTEFLLNLARDAQQAHEVIGPALRRGDICISDRFVYSQLALSAGGRGLAPKSLDPSVELAAQGLWPDLVILVDVEPDLARLRKRLGKLGQNKQAGDSRKGLCGFGLAYRVREYFLKMARNDPARWLVLENNDEPLWKLEQWLVDAVVSRLSGGEQPIRERAKQRSSAVQEPATLETLEEHFFQRWDELADREPQLATFLLSAIPTLAAHQRRLTMLERLPTLVAYSLGGLHDGESHALRNLLKGIAPHEVASSLGADSTEEAMALRLELFSRAPGEVLASLKHNDSAVAWRLREEGLGQGLWFEVLSGLVGLGNGPSWDIRQEALARGVSVGVGKSLVGLGDERAEAMREALYSKDPLSTLKSTLGLDTPLARRLRQELEPKALKLVLRSLTGITAEYAYLMREKAAPFTKEALDSLDGIDQERAWWLRHEHLSRWPSTSVSSVKQAAHSPHGEALLRRALSLFGTRLTVLKNAYSVVSYVPRPPLRNPLIDSREPKPASVIH